MLRCNGERILDPIRAVSDHLSERISLDNEETVFVNNDVKNNGFNKKRLKVDAEVSAKSEEIMNNNLVFRSMFFMNDEPRHFLAPHIPVLSNESEYFQRKATPGGSSQNAASQTSNPTVPEMLPQPKIQPPPKPVSIKHRPHTCEECGKTFLLKHHLATHLRVHTGERPHVCPECGKTFALKHCLSTHLLLHSAERPYKCNECNKSFTLKHHLVSHEKMHTRERPFECRECGQTFAQKRHLSTHLKFHSGERPFSCQECGETFTREEHLIMHSRFHGGLQPYICSDCGAGFLRKFQLVDHERQHGKCPDACPTCGKEFLQKRTLLLHVRTCGLTPNPHSHNVDQNTNLSKVCKECGEAFSSAEGLALHVRLHIGDHSFLSDICSLAASLKQAAGTQTTLFPKKSHICPDCNRTFTQKHGLNQHLIRYPNGACKLKPFRCEKCGKAFSQKNHLVLHERQHMEPSERSELSKRHHSSENQANIIRQLELNRQTQPQPQPQQQVQHHIQKPHLLHDQQGISLDKQVIHRIMDANQMMRHLEMNEHQRQQHQMMNMQKNHLMQIESSTSCNVERNDLKHPMENQNNIMRHLEHPINHSQ